MAIAFDTTQSNLGSGVTTYDITLTTNVVNDVVVLYTLSRVETVSTVTNVTATGITWSKISTHSLPVTGDEMTVWQGLCTTPQAAKTFRITLSGSTGASVAIADTYSGADTTAPLEATNYTDFTASVSPTTITGSVTTITANALVTSCAAHGTAAAFTPPGATAGAGFTNTGNKASVTPSTIIVFGDRANAATVSPGSVNCPWTISSGTFTGSVVGVSIKPLAVAAQNVYGSQY